MCIVEVVLLLYLYILKEAEKIIELICGKYCRGTIKSNEKKQLCRQFNLYNFLSFLFS